MCLAKNSITLQEGEHVSWIIVSVPGHSRVGVHREQKCHFLYLHYHRLFIECPLDMLNIKALLNVL